MRTSPATWLGWTLAVLAMAGFSALGNWQLGRMHEKQAMLDAVAGVLAARDAQPLAVAADPARAGSYDWAAGQGDFVDAPLVLLDNQLRGGRAGVRAYRLFQPAQGAPLLVELGWLPLPGDRSLPAVDAMAGVDHVSGLLLPPPAAGLARATDVARPGDDVLLAVALSPPALAAALGQREVAPRVLRLDPALPGGHARDLDVLPNTLPPDKHLGYAVQWFGLTLAVLATALILTFRKGSRKPRL